MRTSELVSAGKRIARVEESVGGPIAVLGQVLVALCGLGLYELAHVLDGDRRIDALQHSGSVLRFERLVHFDWEPYVQAHVVHESVLRSLANTVYAWGYWPVVLGALGFLWIRDRRLYAILRDAMLMAGGIGLAVFVAFPVAPPRMLPGFFDTISPSSPEYSVVHGSIADPFAALPSFHAGWVAIAAVLAARAVRHRFAFPGAIAVAAAMALAVIATGNHYVVDAVAGILLCALTAVCAMRLHPAEERTPAEPAARSSDLSSPRSDLCA